MSVLLPALSEQDPVKINTAIKRLAEGGSNAIGTFTLTASTTTTTIASVVCSPTAYVLISPQTAHAANDMATTSIVAGSKQFVVTHANNARVDRTFGYLVLS